MGDRHCNLDFWIEACIAQVLFILSEQQYPLALNQTVSQKKKELKNYIKVIKDVVS